MSKISYARHHFPPSVIQHTVWLYLRFCRSLRDVEDLLAERGLDLSYETFGARRRSLARSVPVGSAASGLGRMTGGMRMPGVVGS